MSIVNFSRNGGWNAVTKDDRNPSFEYNPQRVYRSWNVPDEVLTNPGETGAEQLYARPTPPSAKREGKSRQRLEAEASLGVFTDN